MLLTVRTGAAVEAMVGSISPAALSSLNFALSMAQQKDPNFDLRKNLIGADEWRNIQAPAMVVASLKDRRKAMSAPFATSSRRP